MKKQTLVAGCLISYCITEYTKRVYLNYPKL